MKEFSKASNAPLSTNLRRTPHNCVSWNQNQISRDEQTELSKISPGASGKTKQKQVNHLERGRTRGTMSKLVLGCIWPTEKVAEVFETNERRQ